MSTETTITTPVDSQAVADVQQLIAHIEAELASGRLGLRQTLRTQRELTDAQAYLATLTT